MIDLLRTRRADQVVGSALAILVFVIGALAYPAAVFWILAFLAGNENPYAIGTPFTLAQVMAIFGAFGLAGGFSSHGTSDLRRGLRLMATLYLISALCFCMIGMLLPVVTTMDTGFSSNALTAFVLLVIAVAATGFNTGTWVWACIIVELLHREEPT